MIRNLFCLVAFAIVLLNDASSHGQDRNWTNTSNSNNNWATGSNWAEGSKPNSSLNALFSEAATYDVQLTSNESVLDLIVDEGQVNLLGNGSQLTVANDLFVRAFSTELVVDNTSLYFDGSATGTAPLIGLFDNSFGGGQLTVQGGSTIESGGDLAALIFGGEMNIRDVGTSVSIDRVFLSPIFGSGSINVENGSQLTTNTIERVALVDGSFGASGNIKVSGNSNWQANSDSDFFDLTVDDSATVNSLGILDGRVTVSRNSSVTANGIGASLRVTGDSHVTIAGNSRGITASDSHVTIAGSSGGITASQNAFVTVDSFDGDISASAGSRIEARTGNANNFGTTVDGVGSSLALTEDLTSRARLRILGGATASMRSLFMVASPSSTNIVEVSGVDSSLTTFSTSELNLRGDNQDWTMTVSEGASVALGGDFNFAGDSISASAGSDSSAVSFLSSSDTTIAGTARIWNGTMLSNDTSVAIGGDLNIGSNPSSGSSGSTTVILEDSTTSIAGAIRLWNNGTLVLDGGTLTTAGRVDLGGSFQFLGGVLTMTDPDVGYYSIGPGETFDSNRQLHNAGLTIVEQSTNLDLSDAGVFSAGRLTNLGRINVTSAATLGSFGHFDGYQGDGFLTVDNTALTLRDANVAELGRVTSLRNNASIAASNGVLVGNGFVLGGRGTVNGKVATGIGSLVFAQGGDLSLGDSTKYDGFVGQGELRTESNTVTLHDANQAKLGSLTIIGSGFEGGGQLIAANGAVIDIGSNLIGNGVVDSINSIDAAVINNGFVKGDSASLHLTFTGYVKGIGTFDNVTFDGTFDPGHSPAELHVGNLSFSDDNLLIMEIGGLLRGDEHDALISDGLLSFDGDLQIDLINSYDPTLGDSFDLFDWASLTGEFDTLFLPTLNSGLAWDTTQLYTDGIVSIRAVPEPSLLILVGFLGGAIAFPRRRRDS